MHTNSLSRLLRVVAAATASLGLGGCACLSSGNIGDDRPFTIFHPHEVVIYKPQAGVPPADDKVFVYLAIQNNARPNAPMCFANWRSDANTWEANFGHDLIPQIVVASQGAPIIGKPEVRASGVSGVKLDNGDRFPGALPNPADFPYNEANFRRDFAIVLKPDRRAIGKQGNLQISVSIARSSDQSRGTLLPEISQFSIPVTLTNRFRPETMIPEPSEPKR
jgi:hypothetical protein